MGYYIHQYRQANKNIYEADIMIKLSISYNRLWKLLIDKNEQSRFAQGCGDFSEYNDKTSP